MPLFSVVIPVFNRAHMIASTLDSVRNQTAGDFECIVVDDGSDDGDTLRAVVSSLEDPRFVLIRRDHQGGGAARNAGISAARGAWIAFLDSDDLFLPEKLSVVRDAINGATGVEVFSHYACVRRADGVETTRPSRPIGPAESVADFMFRHREFLQTSTLVVDAERAKAVLFNASLPKMQDVDFVLRLERAGARFQFIPKTLSIWEDRAGAGRVGAPRRPEAVLGWYAVQKASFTPVMRRAFEASYLAYEIAGIRPMDAARMIAIGGLSGAVRPRVAMMALLRSFLPKGAYRRLVDSVLKHAPERTDRSSQPEGP